MTFGEYFKLKSNAHVNLLILKDIPQNIFQSKDPCHKVFNHNNILDNVHDIKKFITSI
jgi:hypothetical protein